MLKDSLGLARKIKRNEGKTCLWVGNGSDFCVSMQLHVSSASLHLQMQTWFVFLFFVLFFFEEKKLFILGVRSQRERQRLKVDF